MKWTIIALSVLFSTQLLAQRDFTPSKKRDAFGTRDLRNLRNFGLQFQIGATDYLTRLKNPTLDASPTTEGFRGNYQYDPFGKLGAYAEVGLFHFPKKRSKLSLALKTILVSYFDYGIGFKYFRGGEDVNMKFTDPLGNVLSEEDYRYNFSHGNLYGRFSIHKNIHFKIHREKTNFFLDNSLGLNVDYRLLTTSDAYGPLYNITANAQYTKPLQIQMHYGLGFGFRLKRGSYLIPGVRIPILGYQTMTTASDGSGDKDSSFGRPSSHWYSTRHWPILIGIKYMFLFEKKNKGGCPPVEINSQDKETQQNR